MSRDQGKAGKKNKRKVGVPQITSVSPPADKDPAVARPSPSDRHRLGIPTSNGILYLDHEQILALRAAGSYTQVICENGELHLISRNLRRIEADLPSDLFFRCHRTHVINLTKVASLLNHGGHRALMSTGLKVAVSRSRWEALLQAMERQ